MFTKGIEAVLSRAMSDASFEEVLFVNPEQVLCGFELTTEEAEIFKEISRDELDCFKRASLEERRSFALIDNHNESLLKIK